MKVGFIGLGIMGRPMATRLLEGGHQLWVHNRSPVQAALLEKGATAAPDGRAVAEAAEVIITMVPDTPDVAAVLFGPDGVAGGLGPGKVVVDMSSISPVETRTFAARVEALGCSYLDAPVSGGEVGAKAGTLTIMVGGPEAAFERVRPLFALMGKNVTRVGKNGDGQACKVANQRKDLDLALTAGRQLGVSLPGTATAQQLFNACAAHGGDGWDHSAMVKALELLAGHDVA